MHISIIPPKNMILGMHTVAIAFGNAIALAISTIITANTVSTPKTTLPIAFATLSIPCISMLTGVNTMSNILFSMSKIVVNISIPFLLSFAYFF